MNCATMSTPRGNVGRDNNEIALTAEYVIHCSHVARKFLIEQNLLHREKARFAISFTCCRNTVILDAK